MPVAVRNFVFFALVKDSWVRDLGSPYHLLPRIVAGRRRACCPDPLILLSVTLVLQPSYFFLGVRVLLPQRFHFGDELIVAIKGLKVIVAEPLVSEKTHPTWSPSERDRQNFSSLQRVLLIIVSLELGFAIPGKMDSRRSLRGLIELGPRVLCSLYQ